MIILSANDVRQQSLGVWNQFKDLWMKNAEKNSKVPGLHNMEDLEHFGIGKFAVLCAMGSSLENQVETIKKYRDRVDVICCDKAFGPLLDHGVKADYVISADASIPFHYIEKYIEETDVPLFCTPYANPEWTYAWKGKKYVYVNQDSIASERNFLPIFGEKTRVVPAASNVSNSMVVVLTDSAMRKNVNWSGYEQIYLVGYDYSFPRYGNYYAWNDPTPKRWYMTHETWVDFHGNIVLTSSNLKFSAKWLISYLTESNMPVTNCSGQGLLLTSKMADLKKCLSKIEPNKKMTKNVKELFDVLKSSFEAKTRAEEAFYKSRRELLCQ